MNRWVARLGGASLAAGIGVWAGLSWYAHAPSPLAPRMAGVRVPAGEASPAAPSDVDTHVGDAAPVPAPDKVPEYLPDFALANRAGKPTGISTWRGKSLIINFWATWCAPCRHEMPLLQSIYNQWHGRNVEVIGIAVDTPDKVVAYADKLKIAYPLLIGEQDALDVAASLGVTSPVFPFTVFTDRRGRIVTLYVGELDKSQADLILSAVEKLDRDQWQLPAARSAIEQGLHDLGTAAKDASENDHG